jgi:histidinol phosphatase-like PHP family hydrolase
VGALPRAPELYDLHVHTTVSDGALRPLEMAIQAQARHYTVLGFADHVGIGNIPRVLEALTAACASIRLRYGLLAVAGVEVTRMPRLAIADVARRCKQAGAALVTVHGESPGDQRQPGVNLAAIEAPDVDVLAHPGFLTEAEARRAAESGTYLELSGGTWHAVTNAWVARLAVEAGAELLVGSDAHLAEALMTVQRAEAAVRGAGLDAGWVERITQANPRALLERAGVPLRTAASPGGSGAG